MTLTQEVVRNLIEEMIKEAERMIRNGEMPPEAKAAHDSALAELDDRIDRFLDEERKKGQTSLNDGCKNEGEK